MPQNGDKKLANSLVVPQNKLGPDRMLKFYCCYKPLAHVWPFGYLNERLLSPSLKDCVSNSTSGDSGKQLLCLNFQVLSVSKNKKIKK